jgi:hypothetical protein
MKKVLLLLLLFAGMMPLRAQLSDSATVSIITCGPGAELYSGFGHTAIRIHDPQSGYDMVYNYGMFDFGDPDFYLKFARGKLNYWLGKSPMQAFVQSYMAENRLVKEQVLNLQPQQVEQVFAFLENNALEANMYYAYDFFFDNCATRPRDVLMEVLGDDLKLHEHEDAGKVSFRDIIDGYLENGPYVDLGIDLILGSVIDRKATNEELMFLPDYVFEIVAQSTVEHAGNTEPLVRGDVVVHDDPGTTAAVEPPAVGPSAIFWTLFAIILAFTLFRFSRPVWALDITLFLIMGLLGCFILFMWFGTNHQATADNLNILWTHPVHLFSIVTLLWLRNRSWSHKYFLVLAVITGSLLLLEPVLPQDYHPATKPLILALALRYFSLFRWAANR